MQVHTVPKNALRVGQSRVARRVRPAVNAISRAQPVAPVEDDTTAGPGPSRRHLLTLTAGLLLSGAASAGRASARQCGELTEVEDDACRQALLSRDTLAVKEADGNYTSLSDKKYVTAPNVPVAALDSEYVRATLKLRDEIISYAEVDVNDYKTRLPIIKTLKSDGSEWVSKYARGGSARSDSARRMYIAVDAVIGHLAANGYAPMPKPKLKLVLANVDQAKSFIEIGK